MPLEVNRRRRAPLSDPAKCGKTLTNPAASKLGNGRPVILSDGDTLGALSDPAFRQHVERADAADRLVLKRAAARFGTACDHWFGIVPDFDGNWGAPIAMTVGALNQGGIIGDDTLANLDRTQRSEAERQADADREASELAESARVHAEYEAAQPSLWDDLGDSWDGLVDAAKDLAGKEAIVVLVAVGFAAYFLTRK